MQAGKRTRRAATAVDAERAVREYLKHLKVSGRRQGTVDHDQDKLKPLLDEWSEKPMAAWSRTMLEDLLHERSWSPSRVRQALGVYRRFIAWCRAVGYRCGDFVGEFKPPRARPREHREAYSPEQCRRLLNEARGHYLEVPIALALLTGLSRADLRAITWKEVDLDAGLITRPRHKTGTRLRLPMSEPLREVLLRHRHSSGPVCAGSPSRTPRFTKHYIDYRTGPRCPGAAGITCATPPPPCSLPRGRTWQPSGGSWGTGRGASSRCGTCTPTTSG